MSNRSKLIVPQIGNWSLGKDFFHLPWPWPGDQEARIRLTWVHCGLLSKTPLTSWLVTGLEAIWKYTTQRLWQDSLYLFWWYWNLNSGLYACDAAVLPLEPYFSPFCSGYFGDTLIYCPGWPGPWSYSSCDDRCTPSYPAFSVEMGSCDCFPLGCWAFFKLGHELKISSNMT
jgi:hypothetical protein